MIVLAGAAALAGFGYTLARRSGSRAARSRRVVAASPRRGEARPKRAEPVAPTEPKRRAEPVAPTEPNWEDEGALISSARNTLATLDEPDALDVALDLDGVFDGESATGVTARPNERVPAPHTGDDEDAPSPDDLGRAWLLQATESERSLSTADTLPEVENLLTEDADIEQLPMEEEEEEESVRPRRSSSGAGF